MIVVLRFVVLLQLKVLTKVGTKNLRVWVYSITLGYSVVPDGVFRFIERHN